jgi:glucokinase
LADVVTRCIELRGEVEIQGVNVRHATSKKEMEIAKIRLRTKKRQYQAIESMLKQELQAAEQAHVRSKKLHERGFVTTAEVQATESKIHMLTRALK